MLPLKITILSLWSWKSTINTISIKLKSFLVYQKSNFVKPIINIERRLKVLNKDNANNILASSTIVPEETWETTKRALNLIEKLSEILEEDLVFEKKLSIEARNNIIYTINVLSVLINKTLDLARKTFMKHVSCGEATEVDHSDVRDQLSSSLKGVSELLSQTEAWLSGT